ncbi:MAG TPA: alpha/beta hydrolase [Eoetvoesiella sp.]
MSPINTLPQYIASSLDYPLTYTETGSGQTLLLIHGSLCDYRYWRWQVPALGQHLHVQAPSLRGYWPAALTAESSSFSVSQHTEDLIEFIRRGGADNPVHVLGHSRGAHIALELTCRAPELVRSLTLADPGFPIDGGSNLRAFQHEVVSKLKHGERDDALTQFIDTVNGAGTWRHMVSWFKTMVQDNAYTLLSQINEIDLAFDVARARQVACPVLLLGGADSPARYGHVLDALEPNFARVQRSIIALASHGMNLANPKAFNERVLQFVQHVNATSY